MLYSLLWVKQDIYIYIYILYIYIYIFILSTVVALRNIIGKHWVALQLMASLTLGSFLYKGAAFFSAP